MNTPLRVLALLSLLAIALPGQAADTPASAQLITPAPTVRPTDFVNFNVDFPGGPISQLITAISKIDGVSLNIIGLDQATDFSRLDLPAFTLRNVNLGVLIDVLRSFLLPRGFDLVSTRGGPNPNSMVLILHRFELPKPTKQAPSEFKSFRLSPFLQDQTVDDIVSAIHAGWELDPAHDPKALSLKFHPGTSILLVSGPDDAIRITEDIFRQLKFSPQVPPKPMQPSPSAPEAEKK